MVDGGDIPPTPKSPPHTNEGAASLTFPARVVELTHPSTSNIFCLLQAVIVAFTSVYLVTLISFCPIVLSCRFVSFCLRQAVVLPILSRFDLVVLPSSGWRFAFVRLSFYIVQFPVRVTGVTVVTSTHSPYRKHENTRTPTTTCGGEERGGGT
jgi:hypothetical protein